jgi:hypothetical protein
MCTHSKHSKRKFAKSGTYKRLVAVYVRPDKSVRKVTERDWGCDNLFSAKPWRGRGIKFLL